jgi:hypothetical protein
MGYPLKSRTRSPAEASFQQPQFQPKARRILISWTRAREYRDGETSYLQLAREIVSLQLHSIIVRWRKLSNALPINDQTKMAATEPRLCYL